MLRRRAPPQDDKDFGLWSFVSGLSAFGAGLVGASGDPHDSRPAELRYTKDRQVAQEARNAPVGV